MNKMKYVLNHPWKFDMFFTAVFSSLCQAIVNLCVTMINYIVIISDNTIMEIVMDFLALYVIAELDDNVFKAHPSNDLSVRLVKD